MYYFHFGGGGDACTELYCSQYCFNICIAYIYFLPKQNLCAYWMNIYDILYLVIYQQNLKTHDPEAAKIFLYIDW